MPVVKMNTVIEPTVATRAVNVLLCFVQAIVDKTLNYSEIVKFGLTTFTSSDISEAKLGTSQVQLILIRRVYLGCLQICKKRR